MKAHEAGELCSGHESASSSVRAADPGEAAPGGEGVARFAGVHNQSEGVTLSGGEGAKVRHAPGTARAVAGCPTAHKCFDGAGQIAQQ